MDYEALKGQRIVLRCKNNLSFAGILSEIQTLKEGMHIRVITDTASGFGILCPIEFVKEVLHVPIKENK